MYNTYQYTTLVRNIQHTGAHSTIGWVQIITHIKKCRSKYLRKTKKKKFHLVVISVVVVFVVNIFFVVIFVMHVFVKVVFVNVVFVGVRVIARIK